MTRDSPVPTIGQLTKNTGVLATFQQIRKREGYRGWWSTLWAQLLIGAWTKTIEANLDIKAMFYLDKRFFHPGLYVDAYLRTILRRIIISLVEYPMNFIMTKFMTQIDPVTSKFKFNSFGETYNYISEKEGMLAAYTGFDYYLLNEAVSLMVLPLFEWIEQKVSPVKPTLGLISSIALFLWIIVLYPPLETALYQLPLLCGENVKKSVGEILNDIYQREGLGGWYKIILIRMLRSM